MGRIRLNQQLSAGYWINKMQHPSSRILTPNEIRNLNRSIFYQCVEEGCMFDIRDMENVYAWGICVKRSNIRKCPIPYERCSESEEDQLAAILVNEPVVIIRTSEDRQWYYIYTYYYGGWVKAEDIAQCRNYEEWIAAQEIHNPLVVLGSRVRLECNPYCKNLSQLELSMGTVLEIDKSADIEDVIAERNVCCNYVVRIPIRDQEGKLLYRKAEIPVSSDVSIGYLEYTAENILKQAFKTLGEIYGWGGRFNSRDCSSFVSDVFACFSIKLPRDTGGLQMLRGKNIYINIGNFPKEEKKKLLDSIRPGTILGFSGHVMIYLGKEEENFYVINQVGHFCMKRSEKLVTYEVNSCIVNDLNVLRSNGATWFDSLSYMLPLC